MRKTLLLITFLCLCHIGTTQTLGRKGLLEKKNDSIYIVEGNRKFPIKHDVVTVKLKTGYTSKFESTNKIRSNRLGFTDLAVPAGMDIETFVSLLEKSGNFEVVEFNSIGKYCLITNDTERSRQWYLSTINMFNTWDITMGSSNTLVAILDSGTDWRHPDIGNGSDGYTNIDETLGWNYILGTNNVITRNGHGTRVAGIVGAKSNNSRGIAGISGGNNNVGITMIPFCVGVDGPDGSIIDDAIIDAVDLGARVIQLSLSVASHPAIDAAIDYAHSNNVLVVCAAGNDYLSSVSYPASHQNVIAVGAIEKNNLRANFSNYGNMLDLVAPGVDIYSTTLSNGYNSDDGTSFAAPQVSGIAALILSVRPDLTGQQVRNVIEQTAQKVGGYNYTNTSERPNGRWNEQMGYGLVNAYAAVYAVAPRISGPSLVCHQATYTITNLPPGATVTWSVSKPQIATINSNGVLKGIRWTSKGILDVSAVISYNGQNIPVAPITVNLNMPVYELVEGACETIISGNPSANGIGKKFILASINNGGNHVSNDFSWSCWNRQTGVDNSSNIYTYNGNFAYIKFERAGNYRVEVRKIGADCHYPTYTKDVTIDRTCVNIPFTPFSLVPNPTSNSVNIRFTEEDVQRRVASTGALVKNSANSDYQLQLWSSLGLVKTVQTNQPEYQLDLSGVAPGFYYVHVIKDGQIYRKQLVVK